MQNDILLQVLLQRQEIKISRSPPSMIGELNRYLCPFKKNKQFLELGEISLEYSAMLEASMMTSNV
jgi:hypothetical protein